MRIIVYGLGAVGGVIAAQLTFSGYTVIGIARGRQLEAVRGSGLRLFTPQAVRTAKFAVCAGPEEISFERDDVVLLTMKGPDTAGALLRLEAAGVLDQPVFCFQNGVANEALALRFFDSVYGATVVLPADYDTPGEVSAYFTPTIGAFDIGRYPSGSDEAVEKLCRTLRASGFIARRRDDVMASKYRKLLMNLRNIIDALLPDKQLQDKWHSQARAEAEAVLTAAGIVWTSRRRRLATNWRWAPYRGAHE
jgi:2-dehydropantoate 2-reductase